MNDWHRQVPDKAAAADRARRLVEGLRQPEHLPGLRRGAPPARRLARRARAPRCRPWPPTSPTCTTQGERPQGLDGGRRSVFPREARGPAESGRLSGRPGCSRGTGGPPPIGGAGRRDRSGSRTWRPCSPPATGRGHGVESDQVAVEHGRIDAVIAGLLFMAGMRRSEVSALRWADVADSTDGNGMLVTVRRGKTSPEGEVNDDVRFVKERRRPRPPDAARRHESGAGRPRGAVVRADDRVALHGRCAGRRRREPGHRAFGSRFSSQPRE